MISSALRSDDGRRPRARRAAALAAVLWAAAAAAQASDDGMIVIPGRGETAEAALAQANAVNAANAVNSANAANAVNAVNAANAANAANAVSPVSPVNAVSAAHAVNAANGMGMRPAGNAHAVGMAAAASGMAATASVAGPAASGAGFGEPAPGGVTAAPGAMPGNRMPYGAARTAAPAAADPAQIVTVVAGPPGATAPDNVRVARRPAVAARAPAMRMAAPPAFPANPANPANPAPATAAAASVASAASAPPAIATAATPPGQQNPDAIRRAALIFLQQQIAGLPGKTTATVASAFPRGLAACTTLEPFMPTGARLWGRTTVGVRCAGERPWTVYLQAKVAVQATYYVAARQIAPGEPLTAADLVARDGDLTMLPLAVITDPAQAVGATALARVGAGLPLRQDMLKSAASVSAGQTVRVVAAGPGFTISAEGSALANAAPGQSVRVRMAAGQIVTAIVKDAGTVEIPL